MAMVLMAALPLFCYSCCVAGACCCSCSYQCPCSSAYGSSTHDGSFQADNCRGVFFDLLLLSSDSHL